MSDNTKRKKDIRKAFQKLGNTATTAQIAQELDLNVNGVSQTIGVMEEIEYISGKAGQAKWKNTKNDNC